MPSTVRGIVCAAALAALAPGLARAQGFNSGLVTVGCAVVELIAASVKTPGSSQGQAQNLLEEAVGNVAAARLQRVSTSFSCVLGNGDSFLPDVASDGDQVVFSTRATNLIPDDANNRVDVYVKSLNGGRVYRMSRAPGGPEADGDSGSELLAPAAIAGALPRVGRFVSFSSAATNLTEDDDNGAVPDIFLVDRDADANDVLDEEPTAENPTPVTIARIARPLGDGEVDQGSYDSALSDDGAVVAFTAVGSGAARIFDFDATLPGFTEIEACMIFGDATFDAPPPPTFSVDAFLAHGAAVSADGDIVVFTTDAPLVAEDTNGFPDVYSYERSQDRLRRVSVPSPAAQIEFGSAEGNGASFDADVSAEGKFVVFASAASNLVSSDSFGRADTNGVVDVFRYDRFSGELARVNVTPFGDEALGGDSRNPSISGDGTYVVFETDAVTLNPYPTGDNNGFTDIYMRDMRGGPSSLPLITFSSDGNGLANGPSRHPRMSDNGNVMVFETDATNVIPFDVNGATDVILADNPNN